MGRETGLGKTRLLPSRIAITTDGGSPNHAICLRLQNVSGNTLCRRGVTVKRVVLAMSGGVDSSVAACLLQDQGYEVVGVFMRHGEEPTECDAPSAVGGDPATRRLLPIVDARQASKQGCCTARDAWDARRVADRLQIPFYALNLEADFGRIIDYFVEEYTSGRTPNPCVVCNHWIKFGKLFDYADSIGAEYVATGHYARLEPASDRVGWGLHRGADRDKDQSYVLFGIQPERLPRMLLPVGGYRKPEIRRLAGKLGLRVAEKRDSQEICFVPSGQHAEFVRARADGGAGGGEIVTTTGSVVGKHPGIEGFTIGQRKGLGVALGEPYFVVDIQADTRRVVIGRRDELARSELIAARANWLVEPPTRNFACKAQIRYNGLATPAVVTPLEQGRFQVTFDRPCHGVAPGQAVVCYDEDRVLGGGWIESSGPSASGSPGSG